MLIMLYYMSNCIVFYYVYYVLFYFNTLYYNILYYDTIYHIVLYCIEETFMSCMLYAICMCVFQFWVFLALQVNAGDMLDLPPTQ